MSVDKISVVFLIGNPPLNQNFREHGEVSETHLFFVVKNVHAKRTIKKKKKKKSFKFFIGGFR